jgi:hypothetical protein
MDLAAIRKKATPGLVDGFHSNGLTIAPEPSPQCS